MTGRMQPCLIFFRRVGTLGLVAALLRSDNLALTKRGNGVGGAARLEERMAKKRGYPRRMEMGSMRLGRRTSAEREGVEGGLGDWM